MKKAICLLLFSLCTFTISAIAQDKSHKARIAKKKKNARIQYGTASFYDNKFNGRRTANGDIFSQKKLTAAHNGLPLGTLVRVTNLRNKKTVIVKITDRLHYRNKRLLDLSKAAANKLSFVKSGLLPVKIEVLGKDSQLTNTK